METIPTSDPELVAKTNSLTSAQKQLADLKAEASNLLNDIKLLKNTLRSGLYVDNHIINEGKYNNAISNNERIIEDTATAINIVSSLM